jgi:DNA-binding transcriptional regulator YdaS (Cro superfamily)
MATSSRLSGIREAVAVATSQSALADELGVSKQTVQNWVHKGYVPLEHIKKIEELCEVSRARLCDPLILEVFPEILRGERKE